MGLRILKERDGSIRPTWYGHIIYKGRRNIKNLNIAIKGSVPIDENGNVKLSSKGDAAFELSRKAAHKALEAWRKETRKNPAELQESAYRAHTGISGAGIPFSDLIRKWKALKRQRKPTLNRERIAERTYKRFADFAHAYAVKNGKRCDTLNEITIEIASAWFDSIKDIYAWETVKGMISLMSSAFDKWSTNGQTNPFDNIVMRGSKEAGEEKRRTERKALTPEQFARLIEHSRNNDRFYPLIICAAYTGMRIGDICRMKISDINLNNNTIDCVTQKTGTRVKIPILSKDFLEILEKQCALPADGSKPSQYVFPWAASQYGRNKDLIIRGVKPFFAMAIYDEEKITEIKDKKDVSVLYDIDEACRNAGFAESKSKRISEIYRRFKSGESSKQIAIAMKIARGQVSNYLKDAERIMGESLRPLAKSNGKSISELIEKTRIKRKIGKYAASLWGWHNLRHNFATYALNNGIPIHKVAAIMGHSTGKMTAKYADLTTQTTMGRTSAAGLLPAVSSSPTAKLTPDAIIAALNEDERKELARKLLGL